MEALRVCSSRRRKRGAETKQDDLREPQIARAIPVELSLPKVSFILDNAPIRKALIKKKWVVANGVDDEAALRRQNKNPDDFMSDIVHDSTVSHHLKQVPYDTKLDEVVHSALKAILDSPLNRSGLIGAIFVKVSGGLLFEVKPHVRIPRTLARFSGLMLELLEKSRIRANDTNEVLMRVVEEPVTQHLPANSRIIGISQGSCKLMDATDYVKAVSDDFHLVFVIGASKGKKINHQYADEIISVTDYPVDAVAYIDLVCNACEEKWQSF